MTQQDQQWTVQKLLDWTRDYFTKSQVDSPRLCAEILLSQSLKCKRMDLYLRYSYLPTESELAEFRGLVKRAVAGEPVAYLTGEKEFYSLKFKVTPAVLIPRPETEIIVEQAINHIRKLTDDENLKIDNDDLSEEIQHESQENKLSEKSADDKKEIPEVLLWDICTGSGCISIAIAKNSKVAKVLATDICPRALSIAQENIESHKLDEKIKSIQADLTNIDDTEFAKLKFDVITSNPPYVRTDDPIGATVDREPAKALFAGDDGLDLIRVLIPNVAEKLKSAGVFIMEFGIDQADEIRDIIMQTNKFAEPVFIKDHQNFERTVIATKL